MGRIFLHSIRKVLTAVIFYFAFTTVSEAQALSGSYTIGGTGSSYSSFTNAVSDLVANGIKGPVIFNIAAGNYNETITIPAINGVSATNTITFKGAGMGSSGTRIYYSLSSSGSSVIYLNGCSYITFDHMTIENTSTATTSYSNYPACLKTKLDSFTTLSYCNIKTAISTSVFYNVVGIHFYNSSNGTVINSRVTGGLFGLLNEALAPSTNVTYGGLLVKHSRFIGAYYNHVYGYGYPLGLANDVYDGNSFDSSSSPYISAYQLSYENGATIKNNVADGNIASYLPIEIDYPNYGSSAVPFMIYNNMIGNFQFQGIYIDGSASAILNMNTYVLHNTFDEENNSPSNIAYLNLAKSGGLTFEDNILSANSGAIPLYIKTPKTPKGIMVDGNNYYTTSGTALVTWNSGSYTTIAAYKGAVSSLGWSLYDNNLKPHFVSKKDLHLDQAYLNPSGVYAGIDIDIDGDARCKLFPTSGADESTFGTGNPVVKFYLPSKIYPNSPTYVTQIAKQGEAKRHSWYVNGVHMSDSIVLLTDKFNIGTNTLKLVTITCFGSDSSTQTFTVSAPATVPGTDFISDKNNIRMGDIVTFQDLTTGGPTRWQWIITPDSIVKNGVKVPAIQYVYGNAGFQSPRVQFNAAGNYKVCLSTFNSVGKGATICKKDYIIVSPSYNLGSTAIVHDARGFLYDNGGPFGDYSFDKNVESILIDPCADSVFLTFSTFDMYCGYDYLRLYEGRNNTGKNISGLCTANGSSTGYGQGFTGGKAYPGGCIFQCMPNVVKPDTFKAKNFMYIEMNCYAAYQSAGFAAFWWSKPRVSTKAKASFTVSADTLCTSQKLTFVNTTKTDPTDPPLFLWDLDGDIGTFECIGTCQTMVYPYYIPGPVTITLIATNCGGSDSFSHTIYAYDPDPPKVHAVADNTTPTTSETVFFSAPILQCIDHYRWTINNSNPAANGKPVYINNTDSSSAAPQVNFTDTGYYDVSLYVDNMGGLQKDSVVLQKYIHVRKPYCVPSVNILDQDIGIYKVEFNAIGKTGSQGTTAYTNYVNTPGISTTVARELTYKLTLYRKYSVTPTPINRTVYIDWNGDGSFTGKGEIVLSDSNSTSASYSVNVTIPKSATAGATVMRVAVNKGTYANKPCGKNEYGEYQDFRIYITPYNILPVITLTGKQGLKDTITFDIGHDFTEPGFAATSLLYGDLTKDVVRTSLKAGSTNPADTFNKFIAGATWIFSYNVTDSSGNQAITRYRVVRLTKDKTPPDLQVEKPDTILIAVTSKPVHPVYFPKVLSSIDLIDGSRSVKIDTPQVYTNIVGNYIVTYTSSDASGNTIKVYRVIRVIDSIKPVLRLIGKNPVTLAVFNSYTDSGVLYSDNYYPNSTLDTLLKVSTDLDSSKTGTYIYAYSITDPSGNKGTVTRIIKVVDTIKPVITLSGPVNDSVEVFTPYNDPGYTVTDNYDLSKDIILTRSGTFYGKFGTKNPDVTGVYNIVYTAVDKSGNISVKTRNVKVQDRKAPEIILNGPQQVSVCRWFPYVDAGYTVSDNYDQAADIKVDTFGTFFTKGGTSVPNYLFIQYRATDRSKNSRVSDARIILVKAEDDIDCINGIDPVIAGMQKISVFPNPNHGKFTIEISGKNPTVSSVLIRNVLGQDLAGNNAPVILNNTFEIDLTGQPAGIYFVELQWAQYLTRIKVEVVR
jgi:PKD repeat protein